MQNIAENFWFNDLFLKEHSPTRNQLPLKTHEENSKSQNPHILGVSMKGALWGKKEKKKSADSDRTESQLRRRRVRFGNWPGFL